MIALRAAHSCAIAHTDAITYASAGFGIAFLIFGLAAVFTPTSWLLRFPKWRRIKEEAVAELAAEIGASLMPRVRP